MAVIGGVSSISHLLNAAAVPGTSGAGASGAGGAVGAAGVPSAAVGAPGAAATTIGGGQPASSFMDALGDAIGQLNTQLTSADQAAASFATGGTADLHTVMLELQQASIGLKTGIAVRDKLLEAYQDLMRLQI
jgi:flagellar hook-basal body complex protein FliE